MTSATHIKVRRPRAVWDRTATDTRLLPISSPATVSLGKPPSSDGRSIDCTRHVPYQDLCRISAPSHGRFRLADFTLAEDFRTYLYVFPRAFVPFLDSNPVATGLTCPLEHGPESICRPISTIERCCRTDKPHSEAPSISVSLLRHVWGFSGTAADAKRNLSRIARVSAGVVVFPFTGLGPSIAYSLTPSSPTARPRRGDRLVALGWGLPSPQDMPSRPSVSSRGPAKDLGLHHSGPA